MNESPAKASEPTPDRYKRAMFEKPSYPTCIHFRVNFWKACLELAAQRDLFTKQLEDPSVRAIVKTLKVVHGAFEKFDDILLASDIHGKTRLHNNLDPDEKKRYVFFRIEQVPTTELEPTAAKMYDDFIQYGTSEYYGPYVHSSPLTDILDQEGKIAPIDNLINHTYEPEIGRNSAEDMAYMHLLTTTGDFLKNNPHLLGIIGDFHSEYAEQIKSGPLALAVGSLPSFRRLGSTPASAAVDLKDFSSFFKAYPMLALMVFPPPFSEIMIKDKFRPRDIEYRPIENAKSIDDYPEDIKNSLLGYSVGGMF